ncbi:type II secretion system protein [Geminisphaera colitermitum]|uniref:type II secretion system protein n=1 Tax=Geminisphaera colitermitum TaxID=1148786 RepID=UPI000158C87C|nr:prepilin-type N-terminal cleavage/methylation domain-containing protein [Geminisphaera colitermitum]
MKTRAFTLIELLTVIAIIGILAAIILPVTASVRTKARAAQCKSNIRQWAVAAQLYAADNGGKLPDTSYRGSFAHPPGADGHYVETDLYTYLGLSVSEPITTAKITALTKKVRCTVEGWRYGFNTYIAWKPVTQFTQPSRHILATCSTKGWFDGTAQTSETAYLGPIPKPHSRKVNVVHLDASVTTLFVTQIRWIDFRRDTGTPPYTDETRYMFHGDTKFDQ